MRCYTILASLYFYSCVKSIELTTSVEVDGFFDSLKEKFKKVKEVATKLDDFADSKGIDLKIPDALLNNEDDAPKIKNDSKNSDGIT